jgi:hypothetical protein
MRNCVGMLPRFVRAIRRGKGYFFHVEGNWGMPKATLYCAKHGSHWQIDEVRCWGNQPLASRYVQCLALWLAEKQGLNDESLCLPSDTSVDGLRV